MRKGENPASQSFVETAGCRTVAESSGGFFIEVCR